MIHDELTTRQLHHKSAPWMVKMRTTHRHPNRQMPSYVHQHARGRRTQRTEVKQTNATKPDQSHIMGGRAGEPIWILDAKKRKREIPAKEPQSCGKIPCNFFFLRGKYYRGGRRLTSNLAINSRKRTQECLFELGIK